MKYLKYILMTIVFGATIAYAQPFGGPFNDQIDETITGSDISDWNLAGNDLYDSTGTPTIDGGLIVYDNGSLYFNVDEGSVTNLDINPYLVTIGTRFFPPDPGVNPESAAIYVKVDPSDGGADQRVGYYCETTSEQSDTEGACIKGIAEAGSNGDWLYIANMGTGAAAETASFANGSRGFISTLQWTLPDGGGHDDFGNSTLFSGVWGYDGTGGATVPPNYGMSFMSLSLGNSYVTRLQDPTADGFALGRPEIKIMTYGLEPIWEAYNNGNTRMSSIDATAGDISNPAPELQFYGSYYDTGVAYDRTVLFSPGLDGAGRPNFYFKMGDDGVETTELVLTEAYADFSSNNIIGVANLTTNGITLENGETITNAVDGAIKLQGGGGSNNEDLFIGLESADSVNLSSTTGVAVIDTGSINIAGSDISLSGNITLESGGSITSDSNGDVTIAPNGSGNAIVSDADIVVDQSGTDTNSPSLLLRGDNSSAEVEGSIFLAYGADPYLRFSVDDDGTTPALTAAMDLSDTALTFPTDNTVDIGASGATRPKDLHLAGSATLGGDITLTSGGTISNGGSGDITLQATSAYVALQGNGMSMADNAILNLGSSSDTYLFFNTAIGNDALFVGADSTSRTIYLSDKANYAQVYTFPNQATFTLNIQSGNLANEEDRMWLAHDATNANIGIGSGGLELLFGKDTSTAIDGIYTFAATADTTDATPETIYSFAMTASTTVMIKAECAADGDEQAAYIVSAGISRDGSNNTTQIGSTVSQMTVESDVALDLTIAADDTAEAADVNITGKAASNIDWKCKVTVIESE